MAPKYQMVADSLRTDILDGVYQKRMLLPTEQLLCQQFPELDGLLPSSISQLFQAGRDFFPLPLHSAGHILKGGETLQSRCHFLRGHCNFSVYSPCISLHVIFLPSKTEPRSCAALYLICQLGLTV